MNIVWRGIRTLLQFAALTSASLAAVAVMLLFSASPLIAATTIVAAGAAIAFRS